MAPQRLRVLGVLVLLSTLSLMAAPAAARGCATAANPCPRDGTVCTDIDAAPRWKCVCAPGYQPVTNLRGNRLSCVVAPSPPPPPSPDALRPFAVGLWGDLPYSVLQATVGMPNLIADMNAHDLAFTVHDGDLKQGSNSPCDNAMYAQALGFFNQLKAPAAFTPGDNDWVDCDRANNGGFNSLERLDYERELFFSTSFSLGQNQIQQEVQTAPLCPRYSATQPYPLGPCPENRRWVHNGVMFMTANVQGSCNNLCDTNPDPEEFAGRNAANIAWLNETFAAAKAQGLAAVMIISQANPGFDLADTTRAPTRDPQTLVQAPGQPADGFFDWLVAVRANTIEFARPVAYVNGDSHYFRVDKPLLDKNGKRIQWFTRVETFGDNQNTGNTDVTWLKVNVDPSSREVFSFVPMLVPNNIPTDYAARRMLRA
ncbi:hypothetical protein HYH03_010911 [Edaphochlamys debaryana]|uniref:Uncharacterized protein n=1 Tax=Edaphochlamys debaryana TaxID=47281 RepID=A0A835XV48_9CHLO|nr:hypothetical protein HYH03_010911 [Edaphochlamys debaryana]|eukprot:KAG2490758.1 hypothetical protein HYH03_010911 [Edaphochlamys debaryana]